MNLRDLLDELEAGGMISAETAPKITAFLSEQPAEKQDATRAWYVRLLIGISAWLAALLFGFGLGVFNVFNSTIVMVVLGTIFLIGATLLRRSITDASIFLTQLALSVSLLGQGLLFAAAASELNTAIVPSLLLFVLSCLLFLVYPDRVHRTLSVLIASVCLFVIVAELNIELGYHVLTVLLLAACVWLWSRADRRWDGMPARYAMPLCDALPFPLLIGLIAVTAREDQFYWLSGIAVIVAAAYVTWLIAVDNGLTARAPLFVGLVVLLGIITISEPGLLAALTLVMLGFWRGSRALTLIASLFFLYFIGSYYYRLDIILLTKSFVLLLTGVILLASWAGLRSAAIEEAS